MITTDLAISVLISIAGLLALFYLAFWMYRDYQVDRFRQQIFSFRDELFDYAAAGKISFDHPAYTLMRRTMNGYIRFAHQMTFTHLLVGLFVAPASDGEVSFNEKYEQSTAELPSDVKRIFDYYRMKMEREALIHILFATPESIFLLMVIIGITLPIALIIRLTRSYQSLSLQRLIKPQNDLDNMALLQGQ